MKNLPISLLFVALAATSLRAQTPNETSKATEKASIAIPMSKGSRFVGLNGTGGFGGSNSYKHDTWSLTGQGGYFVANRLLVGLQLSYGEYDFEDKAAGTSAIFVAKPIRTQNTRSLRPEIFTRYYFTSWKVKPFAQLSAGWNFQSGNTSYLFGGENTVAARNSFTAAAGLGLSFRVSRRVNIDLLYNRNITNTQSISTPTSLRLGVTFLIGK
ncbi:outer membrane beta-barrel protein [Persicitalea sp.]|uniref:outer membrane beta-barrel protein n=1 Tax=Persicitalea sp. TaxID=3100273 RepID=UPI0035948328